MTCSLTTLWKHVKSSNLDSKCSLHSCKLASDEYLAVVHNTVFIEYIKAILSSATVLPQYSSEADKRIAKKAYGGSLFFNEHTLTAALLAAGAACDLCDAVCEGKLKNGFALVRPPGHHAGADYAKGFCFFNNAAIAAGRAIAKHNLKRVFIMDFDVHHGKYVT